MRNILHRSRARGEPSQDVPSFHFALWTPENRRWMAEDFGLTQVGNQMAFNGVDATEELDATDSPGNCYQVITRLRKQRAFTHVCVLASDPTLLVINTTPRPAALQTSLDQDGRSEFVDLAIDAQYAAGMIDTVVLIDEKLWVIKVP